MRPNYEVLKKPIMTDKSIRVFIKQKIYTFAVALDASKPEIQQAIQSAFSVKVKKVRTCIVHSPIRKTGKSVRKIPNLKKAMIELVEGHVLPIYDDMYEKIKPEGTQ